MFGAGDAERRVLLAQHTRLERGARGHAGRRPTGLLGEEEAFDAAALCHRQQDKQEELKPAGRGGVRGTPTQHAGGRQYTVAGGTARVCTASQGIVCSRGNAGPCQPGSTHQVDHQMKAVVLVVSHPSSIPVKSCPPMVMLTVWPRSVGGDHETGRQQAGHPDLQAAVHSGMAGCQATPVDAQQSQRPSCHTIPSHVDSQPPHFACMPATPPSITIHDSQEREKISRVNE